MSLSPLALTQQMVRIPSVLPHEQAMSEFVAEQIRHLGLEPRWQEVSPGRSNVWCVASVGSGHSLVTLTGHVDTVDVAAGWETDPFHPTLTDGRLYGLGAVDMKSGLACALVAFERLLRSADDLPRLGRIAFAATVDEEGLGTGARALLATDLGTSNLMLLPEPFSGATAADPVPIAMTGKLLYRIRVQGRSSHALCNPERGINAIDDAARIVAALDRLPLGSHPLLGRANYSTLKIDGGYREYAVVVPEHCEVIVTRLLVPGETRELAVHQIEELIAALQLHSAVVVETPPPAYQPFALDPACAEVGAFREAYQQVHGRAPVLAGMLGIADNNIYVAEGGIPTIAHGPRGAGLHEAGEYVEVASLDPCVDVLVETVQRFTAQG